MKQGLRYALSCAATLAACSAAALADDTPRQSAQELAALIEERSGLVFRLDDVGWEWKEADVRGNREQGEIRFADAKWLMYLIHWGPTQVPEVTPEYVRKRMSEMWGVQFDFTGKEGRTQVAGHEAVWVEAFGTDRAFYTRFIVWNCPESQRELIADTNYNLVYQTPEADFEDETRSAHTIRCHEKASAVVGGELDAAWDSPRYRISFRYPERWFFIDSPFYVPFPEYDGVRDYRHGSLLGLCSDQNIRVTLKWEPATSAGPAEVFMTDPAVLARLKEVMTGMADVTTVESHGFETFTVAGKKVRRIWGACEFKEPDDPRQRALYTGKGIFEVAQWEPAGAGRTVSLALVTRQYRYQSATSTPSRASQDLLMRQFLERIN